MIFKKTEKLDTNLFEMTFTVEKTVFDAAVSESFKKRSKNITLPGFRKGKAPRSLIEKMYGKEYFIEEAINDILPAEYDKAADASGLKIVSRPDFDSDYEIDDEGLTMKAKVYVKPEVSISDYFGLTAHRTTAEASEDEVNDRIESVRDRNSRMLDITDRAAQMGDTVNIDFEGSVDGEIFEGGTSKGFDLALGSGQFIPGFEEQIAGHTVGDEFDVNVDFPAEYHAEALAGKPAVFKVKLNTISSKELPALDDEFARDVSEFDTLDEYINDIRAKINERLKSESDRDVESQLLSSLIEKLDADIPTVMFETECDALIRDYDNRLRMQGLDLESYMKYTGMTPDTMKTELMPQAERQVKIRLSLEKIAEIEKLEATDEDIENEYKKLSEAYNMEADKVKELVGADSLKDDIVVNKALELVREKAVITDKAPDTADSDKPAAKKAPAKSAEAKKAPAKKTAAKDDSAKTDGAEKKPAAKKPAAKKATAKKDEDKAE